MNLYRKHKVILLSLFGILLLLVYLNSRLGHLENDEVVYKTLVEKIACKTAFCVIPDLKYYNIQNTPILKILDKQVYDHPIFFRPPAFIFTLALFYSMIGKWVYFIINPALYIFLSILMYELLYLITKNHNIALKGLSLVIVSPFLLFQIFKLWMDMFLTFFIFLSLYLILLYQYQKKQLRYAFLSCLSVAIAILTKYQAVLVLPLLGYFLIKFIHGNKLFRIILVFAGPLLLAGLWFAFIIPFHPTIQFLFSNKPTAYELANFPFLKYVATRPVYYYFSALILINPIYLMIINWKDISQKKFPVVKPIAIFVLFVLFVLSCISTIGSFQSRYILIIQPFLILLTALIPFNKNIYTKYFSIAAIFIAFITLAINISNQSVEIFSIPEMFGFKI